MTDKTKATRGGRQWVHKKKNRPLGAVNKDLSNIERVRFYSTTQCAAVKDWAGYLCCCMACLISWSPKNGMTCLTGDIKQAIASRKASTHKTHVPMPIDSPLFKMMIGYQPFGSMPRCCSSFLMMRFIHAAKDSSPSACCAISICSRSSGSKRNWNGGLPRLSVLCVDTSITPHVMYLCVMTHYTQNTRKTTPRSAGTHAGRLTTNAN